MTAIKYPLILLSAFFLFASLSKKSLDEKGHFGSNSLRHFSNYEDDFTKAEDLYNEFRSEFLNIKMVNAQEAEKIVTAICEAEEAERQDASRDASSRAKSVMSARYIDIKSLKDNTDRAIKTALVSVNTAKSNSVEYKKNGRKIDDYLKKLDNYSDDLSVKWGSVEKMTAGIRGNNHPVVAWMMEAGQAAHEDRQERSEFFASEVDAGSAGRIDCITINGNELIVVELKPCNDKAKSKARTQIGRYISELMNNWTSKYKKILIAKDSKFSGVIKISGRCDCYTICPVITDEGDYEKAYVKWEQGTFTVSGGTLK